MLAWIRISWGMIWRTIVFISVLSIPLWMMNKSDKWDTGPAMVTNGAKVEGEVGLVVVALAMPENYDPMFFENFIDKLFGKVIPWPINVLAGADAGIPLVDPNAALSTERYTPEILGDVWGRTKDIDGIPWAEKYKRGEARWVAPSKTVPHDFGYFLYPKRKAGMRTPAAKTLLKARYIQYAALPNGYLPHEQQTKDLADAAIQSLMSKRLIKIGKFADAFDPWQKEQAVREVLNSGIDTLLLSTTQPFYSDFEELNGSFQHIHHVVEAWEEENPGKHVKVVISPSPAEDASFDQYWANHLRETVPDAVGNNQKVKVVASLHGLPPSLINSDIWAKIYPRIIERMKPTFMSVMKSKGYQEIEIVSGFEGFADDIEDPKNVSESVAEHIQSALDEKLDAIYIIPVEFFAENTDSIFTHSALMFEGLTGYKSYQGPPKDVDWSKPFIRQFRADNTDILYIGSPGGDTMAAAGEVLANAIAQSWE